MTNENPPDGRSSPDIEILAAGVLEDGQICPYCQRPINGGDPVGRCRTCGHLQHDECWKTARRCCAYPCEPATARPPDDLTPQIVVTENDVERVVLPVPTSTSVAAVQQRHSKPVGWSKLAIASFVCAVLGIVVPGVPGLLAIGLGVVAAGSTYTERRLKGAALAAGSIALGAATVVGWTLAGVLLFSPWRQADQGQSIVTHPIGTRLLPEDSAHTPDFIRRAIRANVLIVVSDEAGSSEGSGVVIEARDSRLYVVTNRHVIDGGVPGKDNRIDVTFFDGDHVPGRVEWRGDDGVDLALVSCDGRFDQVDIAPMRFDSDLAVGSQVFAVGNPFGLGWSYNTGTISAVRRQTWGGSSLLVIQTQTPLNPGNSGGGLYDSEGRLIGINTITADKKRTEGIGFALAIFDLIPLIAEQTDLVFDRPPPTSGASR